ncbi:2,3-bisphosphoglycerate-independent phosphoglycerate mutase [Pseudogemmobacter faecipullorum]|uniref:2,3-bisphosphoglycerate-independent phosphoglycerate mutase n=1 Tax=Pseudogemmobacter faecipullorum TaxID=2755041 RepID=A0ABS8CGT5_9RHOB|nr:2,3-bisphosphoglycerate-independent phosphoglycerate mutase [Pseudogemmobacter faecipullorum]MCB5408602.1 2,3-bisphosphoglycerate-independent phosphoglycerate mutase [Pseudogemmobacter faecipullorum]
MPAPKPVVLCILDGWGIGPDPATSAPAQAQIPTYRRLMRDCPNATLVTFGPDAGLPSGQMGNSEVGHTNIGAGRVVAMDLGQIDLAVETGSFGTNAALRSFISAVETAGGTAHLAGLCSPGGVHAHQAHMIEAAKVIAAEGIPVVIHAITDGRDVAPASAASQIAGMQAALPASVKIVTVTGRYFAMDRDNRWERVEQAYRVMVGAEGQAEPAASAAEAIARAYARGETDEFIPATVIGDYQGMKPGDGLFFLNFRADRAREILAAIGDEAFAGFARGPRPQLSARLGMVDYSEAHNAWMTTMFPKQDIANTLGEWVSKQGKTQFRLAETEKYPHVTFFLNGGREAPFPGEDRYMPKSPKVATYDLQPEMSAPEVTEHFVRAIEAGYDLIVVNYANPDMVGHTGKLEAAMKACEAVDQGLSAAIAALEQAGGAMVICADHGNCDVMTDPETGQPHTAHTLNPVPVILVGGPEGAGLENGRLADLAPTLLDLMGITPPEEMTGKSLIRRAGGSAA